MDSEDTRVRRDGRIAGILFIAASIGALRSLPFADPSYEAEALAMTVVGCASGASA